MIVSPQDSLYKNTSLSWCILLLKKATRVSYYVYNLDYIIIIYFKTAVSCQVEDYSTLYSIVCYI